MQKNAYGNYLKQEVEGASRGKLVVMLYEACIKFLKIAIKAIEEKNIEAAHNNIIKAQNIVYELMATLNTDEGGQLADHLLRLYDYVVWELVEANVSKNTQKIENVLKVMTPLKDAWREAVQKESAPKEAQEAKSINIAG
jgi:flagellar protein FliS